MKSLRSTGSSDDRLRRAQVVERAAEVERLGEDRQRGRAAALVGEDDLVDRGALADRARRRRAPLVLGDQRDAGAQQRLRERPPLGALGDRRLQPRQRHALAAPRDLVARVLDDPLQHAHAPAPALVVMSTRRSRASRAPRGRRRSPPRRRARPPRAIDAAGDVDRRARVEDREVALRAGLAVEDPPRRLGVAVRRAAGQLLRAGTRQPDVLGGHLVGVNLRPVDLHDARCPRRAHLVQTVGAGHYQCLHGTKPRQRSGDRVQERRVRHPDDLPGGAGGVGERAEEVEDRAHGELLAHRDDEPRGAVVRGREHEAEAGLLDAAGDRLGLEVDPDAERLEQVGRARQAGGRAVAVLGDRAAGAGGDQRRRRRDVERRAPAARAGGVDQVLAAGAAPAWRAGASSSPARPARRRSPPSCAARSAPPRSAPRRRCPP